MYRRMYIGTAATSTIGAATVPVLINLGDIYQPWATAVSLLVTILVGLEGLIHFREHWRNYDLMKTILRQEAYLYRSGSGVYRDIGEGEAFRLFVERIETEIAKERSHTIVMRTSRSEAPAEGKASFRNPP